MDQKMWRSRSSRRCFQRTPIACALSSREARAAVILTHPNITAENLFVTKDGRLKILDFGLAKPTHQEEGGQSTNLPTERRARSRVVVADGEPGTPVTYWASSRPWLHRTIEILAAPLAVLTAESASTSGFRVLRAVPRPGTACAFSGSCWYERTSLIAV